MRVGILWLPLLLVAFGCGAATETAPPESTEAPPENSHAPVEVASARELDVDAVAERLAAGEEIFMLDVRTPEELAETGAIEGYVNIPIDELEARLSEVPKDIPIVAY